MIKTEIPKGEPEDTEENNKPDMGWMVSDIYNKTEADNEKKDTHLLHLAEDEDDD